MNELFPETETDIQALLEAHPWTFARTMPKNPHEYTLRKTWEHDQEFVQVVLYIRTHGKVEWWPDAYSGRAYVYLDLGGWHYWTMGDPVAQTILINRKKLGA